MIKVLNCLKVYYLYHISYACILKFAEGRYMSDVYDDRLLFLHSSQRL